MRMIGARAAIKMLNRAVMIRGEEFKYSDRYDGDACNYIVDGEPACIVGVALYTEGVSPETLKELDNHTPESPQFLTILEQEGLSFTTEASLILRKAQSAQDQGTQWGPAVARAQMKVV